MAAGTWSPPSKVGDYDPTISDAKRYLRRFGYGKQLDDSDLVTAEFIRVLQVFAPKRNDEIRDGHPAYAGDPYVRTDGVYDWTVKTAVGVLARQRPPKPVTSPAREWRPIFFFSAPGSGANNTVGPSNDVGERCRIELGINHIRLTFPIGGYLGLMGGDPGLSYLEVIAAEDADLERQIDAAIAEIQRRYGDRWAEVIEFWFSGYSQSADGMVRAVLRLFGDGGRFAYLRHRINGLLLVGNPARQPGPTKIGNAPKGWGIARLVIPPWLQALVVDICTDQDMYATAEDATLLPLLYQLFIRAELDMSFVMFAGGLLIPVLTSYLGIVGPLFGGLFGNVGAQILAGAAGMSTTFLGDVVDTGATTDPELDQFRAEFTRTLSAQGLLSVQGVTKISGSLKALTGLQAHGEYWVPKPEFGGRWGIHAAFDHVAGFRR
ncbi:peptidoglycan-binding protein [Mycobacterium sp. MYCO198283]|uniref:peptidoglycan-binding protein n=1 Tax=Mycobacterium sp. MYCO198283 TaxID=2883505 RepID=UPI001E32175F|nr:peptidoglycan-binding protein [Mycobacterium sp. MYCO198283]MCG5431255.1 peptidoglycan-binding protein [Mycobacterium sp. MYCO198283]